MNKIDYAKYEAAVAANLKGLSFVSTGACPGCHECGLDGVHTEDERQAADEPGFSWRACEACGSTLGGNRYPAHACPIDGDGMPTASELVHLNVCPDCLYYLNYGRLDDQTMLDMEKEGA